MAIKLDEVYAGRVDTTDPNYTYGKPRNKQGDIDGTGTPYEELYFQDISGAFQALLAEGGITPSGVPDNVINSDIRDAVRSIVQKYAPVKEVLKGLGYSGNFGYFVEGFDYVETGDLGFDTNLDAYVYIGTGAPVKTVTAGIDPSTDNDYFKVDLSKVSSAYKGRNSVFVSSGDTIPLGTEYITVLINEELIDVRAFDDITFPLVFTSVSPNSQLGYEVVTDSGNYEFVTEDIGKLRGQDGGDRFGSGYGIPAGADQGNLADFQGNFPVRVNPDPVFGGFIGINNPQCGSVFDLASFGGQGIPGFNPIGFVYHHYSDSRMVQMDNVGSNNEILYLKNANNPVRRADQAADYIGSGKFISANRQESDGAGGVTGTLEGFYMSKDFELVWPMQATGVNTVRLWNNVAAGSAFWTHEFKNTHEQQFLFRIDNGGTNHFEVEWSAAAQSTRLVVSNAMQIKAENGDLILDADGGIVKFTQVARKAVFSRSTLPTLTSAEIGAEAYLQDGSDLYPIHWNGSSWRKVSDNTPA